MGLTVNGNRGGLKNLTRPTQSLRKVSCRRQLLADVDATEQAARTSFVAGTGSPIDDLALLTRCALVRSTLHGVIHSRGAWSAGQGYKRLQDQEERAIALGSLAAHLSGDAGDEILDAALTLAKRARTTGEALCRLLPLVDDSRRLATVERALRALRKTADADSRAHRVALAAYVSEPRAVGLVVEALLEVDEDERPSEWPRLGGVAASLPVTVVAELWSWSRQLERDHRHLVQGTLCSGLASE